MTAVLLILVVLGGLALVTALTAALLLFALRYADGAAPHDFTTGE